MIYRQWTGHGECITEVEVCVRGNRVVIVSASSDCSLKLWAPDGMCIGTFGQVIQCSHMYWQFRKFIKFTNLIQSTSLINVELHKPGVTMLMQCWFVVYTCTWSLACLNVNSNPIRLKIMWFLLNITKMWLLYLYIYGSAEHVWSLLRIVLAILVRLKNWTLQHVDPYNKVVLNILILLKPENVLGRTLEAGVDRDSGSTYRSICISREAKRGILDIWNHGRGRTHCLYFIFIKL